MTDWERRALRLVIAIVPRLVAALLLLIVLGLVAGLFVVAARGVL